MSEFNLFGKIEDNIESWDKKELVRFCLFCCCKVKHIMNDKSLKAVELAEKWLEDESSVSKKELITTGNSTYECFGDTSYTAYTVICAIETFSISNSVYWTTRTAYWTSKILNSSEEALYLEFMRGRLSDIMEG